MDEPIRDEERKGTWHFDPGTNTKIFIPDVTEAEWLAYHCGSDNLSGYHDP